MYCIAYSYTIFIITQSWEMYTKMANKTQHIESIIFVGNNVLNNVSVIKIYIKTVQYFQILSILN